MTQAIDTEIKAPVLDTRSKNSSTSDISNSSDSDSSLDITILKLNGQSAFGNERELEAYYEPCEGYVCFIHLILELNDWFILNSEKC